MIACFIKVLSAAPTPVEVTLRASHVHAPRDFFHRHLALGASMCTNMISPALVQGLLSSLTAFPLVPLDTTLKAKVPLALGTINLLSRLISFYNLTAVGIGAEFLFSTAYCDLMIHLKLLELLIGLIINDLPQEIICDDLTTPLLGTL